MAKSTLLRAFGSLAHRLGHEVLWAELRDFPPSPRGLLRALGA
ncbi:MAG: hypothetical protein M0031_14695 [Thermaerobacter sp.]|nr:hypothetical protein [Thermaerobacter sp.]